MYIFIIHHLSFIIQKLAEFRHRSGPVADMVLDLHTEFCEGLIVAVRLEDGIIAEALPSPVLTDDLTIDDTLKLMDILDTRTATWTDVLLLY